MLFYSYDWQFDNIKNSMAMILFSVRLVPIMYYYNGRYAMPKKKKKEEEEEKKRQRRLTTVLHIRELPHLHMKLAVWFSFPTTNNKNPMIPS